LGKSEGVTCFQKIKGAWRKTPKIFILLNNFSVLAFPARFYTQKALFVDAKKA